MGSKRPLVLRDPDMCNILSRSDITDIRSPATGDLDLLFTKICNEPISQNFRFKNFRFLKEPIQSFR